MPVEVTLPQLGESTFEGTIGRWLKKPGDRVERFEPLVEIITDKVNVEMPAPVAGVLTQILVPEGQTVPVGTPIALVETAGAPPVEAAAPAGPPPAAPAAPPEAEERVRLSPVVRRLAEEHGIPLEEVARLRGSGAGGRVTKEDLVRYLETRQAGRAAPGEAAAAAPPAPAAAAPPAPAAAVPVPPIPPAVLHPGDQLLKLSPLRRSVAQRMAQSKREIPHAYGVIEVDLTSLVRWREAHKDQWRAREGVNITYTAFFVRAAVDALKAFPIVNSTWSDDGIILRRAINIGVGIALDEGLVVAVIKQADQKNLVGIARELEDLSRRAREGRLTLDDVQGGTFTITNPGVFGSIWSMPIIVPGQAAILATDAIVKRPVVRGDAIAIRDIMHLGLAFDHRIFDGAVADRFLHRIREKLEGFAGGDAALTDF
jgi:2-oxoisovalerate dehydrogenase E2 component (dihydrolipoyl transacylase)